MSKEWQKNPGEAHTDKCECCGNANVTHFDKEGFYVICEGCYNASVNILAGYLQDMHKARERFTQIVMPTLNDFETAYRQLVNPGASIAVRLVFNKMLKNAHRAGIVFPKNWTDKLVSHLEKSTVCPKVDIYNRSAEVSEREQALGCCYNSILRLTTLLREDAEKDDDLGKALDALNLAFENIESHWDFYHRAYLLDDPLY